ncbi:monovalent cation:proton antiporter-2 (CPA2) family protein [Bordetella pseudohinzii]|nr:monovalent cation:proton antiporter-2 (CPA2) family protein [Bordetella pseudohinzii]ANY18199.1 potassium transporter [Bordetella pseudohinzii]KMM27306.1 potassium transporter [Bordetella pseudohinzii]KXA79468.1 potassium transporter [Bordetella pseudohinzii]KXA82757.1 potassium transporter [Bordetella pseudohinzii]
MAADMGGGGLVQVLTLLGAAVVAVPLFRKLGLGSVLGYLAAGLAIGPFGLGLIRDDGTLLHVAELGVVMFLFVIGLEMRPSHLWGLRRQIFGLGSVQILVCGLLLTGVGRAFGFSLPVSFVSAMGFVLTSTAVVVQILGERGDIAQPAGQKVVSVLLFEDLMIVPLLLIVAFLAPAGAAPREAGEVFKSIGIAAGALAALIAAGLWLLNPLFRILARAQAREVMTAAALLVVLGAAVLMEKSHLSMAMGAFMAGVLLSESSFRHQLEADIEPFRGLLLGLFFLAVGLSLRLDVVLANWPLICAGVIAMMAVKGLCIYAVARVLRSSRAEALDRAILMAQGGEFAFVLYQAANQGQVINDQVNANMTAIIVLSMVLTPLVVLLHARLARKPRPSLDGVEPAQDLKGCALIVGFGRVGQIASQGLLASGAEISIIDHDPEVIRNAEKYGFKVYYGDGARGDVLRAAGLEHMRAILVCVDDKDAATRIVENVHDISPQTKVLVRAWDREHAVALVKQDADYVVRETFESAMLLGREAVRALGASDPEADAYMQEVRRRDAERFALETTGGIFAGRDLILGNMAKKQP